MRIQWQWLLRSIFISLIIDSLVMGCRGIDLFSPDPLDRGLCRNARTGGEDVSQCLEAQQSGRR